VSSEEELFRIVESDDKVLKAVWKYVKSSRFDREVALSELKEMVKDKKVLDAALKYAREAKSG
jgi:predicted RNA binding protein with dsRBD fold (UPF0201 family)